MPQWKAKPLTPSTRLRTPDAGAKAKLVSKAIEPHASTVASHGDVSSARCAQRTRGPPGRDHMPS